MRIIVTGASGMVGKGVLLEALDDPAVTAVLSIGRSRTGLAHPKLSEVELRDLTQAATIRDRLVGYDALFHCMGVSSAGMEEAEYARLTYDITVALAETALAASPALVCTYVSGAGTDSTEKGRMMWARVKGRTENKLLAMPFRGAYMFRPGLILPERGAAAKSAWVRGFYNAARPFYGLMKRSDSVTSTSAMGRAMLECAASLPQKRILDPPDINALAKAHEARARA